MQQGVNIEDYYPQWIVHGSWPCGHVARIDLGRFLAWGMHDVPMVALCKRLRCPICGGPGLAEIGLGWVGHDALPKADGEKVRELTIRPRKK